MQWIMVMVGWALSLGCAGIALFWLAAAIMIRTGQKAAPPLESALENDDEGDDGKAAAKVSIVVPAHNEEQLIDEAIRTMRKQTWPALEIIVVADRCTDGTVEIVRRHAAEDDRIHLVELDHCPDGWSGKCHSCWNGFKHATGEYLLFTDADTLFGARLVEASMNSMRARELDFLSLLGSLRFEYDFEKTAQPVAAMTLMRMYPLAKANRVDPKTRRPFANGQFMLFRREPYERIGTHERLKDAILEDLRFARRMTNHGYRLGVTLAGPLFVVRMYENWDEFVRGWKRILIEAANRNVPRLRAAALRLNVLAITPFVAILAIVFGIVVALVDDVPLGVASAGLGVCALVIEAILLAWIYRLQGAPFSCVLRYPAGCMKIAKLVRDAAGDLTHKRGIEWARLHYNVDERDEREIVRKQEKALHEQTQSQS